MAYGGEGPKKEARSKGFGFTNITEHRSCATGTEQFEKYKYTIEPYKLLTINSSGISTEPKPLYQITLCCCNEKPEPMAIYGEKKIYFSLQSPSWWTGMVAGVES